MIKWKDFYISVYKERGMEYELFRREYQEAGIRADAAAEEGWADRCGADKRNG